MTEKISAQLGKFFTKSPTPESDVDKIIIDTAYRFGPGWSVLYTEFGKDKSSIYLARLGFKVTVFSISEADLKKIKELADKEKLEIRTVQGDLTNPDDFFRLGNFQAIYSINQLQRLLYEQIDPTLSLMKSHTENGGYNIIQTEGTESEGSDLKSDILGEILRKSYSRWLKGHTDSIEYYGKWESHAGEEQKHRQYSIKLIARKLV